MLAEYDFTTSTFSSKMYFCTTKTTGSTWYMQSLCINFNSKVLCMGYLDEINEGIQLGLIVEEDGILRRPNTPEYKSIEIYKI